MAHTLRYYREFTPKDKVIRIEFHEKDGIAPAMEIGPIVESMGLEIIGNGDIDQPIVKTMLNFTFVDAPDHPERESKKCGAWEEFYSPDATAWKVLIKVKEEDNVYRQIWGGYITPDSFHEILTYRGGVSFIARDNIGHLQDFPFDAEGNADGMISLSEIIHKAWDKIESPMTINTFSGAGGTGRAEWLQCEGVNASATYMNVSAFKDKNWYEVLESVLYSYGLVMRYVGNNTVAVYALRNLPNLDFTNAESVIPVFQTGAERELSPAVRRIEETMEYALDEALPQPLIDNKVDFTGEVETHNVTWMGNTYSVDYWELRKNEEGQGWINSESLPSYFNPLAYPLAPNVNESDLSYLWLAVAGEIESSIDGRAIEYSRLIEVADLNVDIQFGNAYYLDNGRLTKYKYTPKEQRVYFLVKIKQNGITQYLNDKGEWTATKSALSVVITDGLLSFSIPKGDFTGEAFLSVKIMTVGTWGAAYIPIYSVTYTTTNAPLLSTNRVNTNYNEQNNVILSRSPKMAPAMDMTFMQGVIKNGIFIKQGTRYFPAKLWSWIGNGKQQMAVYNHLQLLCYYAKPNNILSGTIVNADVTDFAKIYMWQGAEHILTSGTLNLISGYIENASLREFMRYENMWGDVTDTADLPEVESETTNNVDGGGSSSQSATYSNTTEVNIGGGGTIILDSFMSDDSTNGVQNRVIKSYVDNAIDDVKEDIEALELWKKAFTEKFYIGKDGNVYCAANLVVDGETSSSANGQNTPGAGGLDIETLERYLNNIGNIDASNIANQNVSAATKIAVGGTQYLWIDENHLYANDFYITSKAVKEGRGFGFFGNAKDYGLTAEQTSEAALVQLGGYHGVRINTYIGYALYPAVNDRTGLGTSSLRWSSIYGIDGDFSGNVTIKGTSNAAMSDGAGALNIGSGAVLMLDANDIQAKANGTTPAPLYINSWGGALYLGHVDYTTECKGAFKAPSVSTPLLQSVSGLDIIANNGAAGARLWLTTGSFRPWGADSGLIDLGTSGIQWRTVYAINIVASGDVATM